MVLTYALCRRPAGRFYRRASRQGCTRHGGQRNGCQRRRRLGALAEVGFFRAVRVKGFDSMVARTLVSARTKLVMVTTDLSNQIRGLMKTSRLIVPAGKGSRFEANVRILLAEQDLIAPVILPLLEAW